MAEEKSEKAKNKKPSWAKSLRDLMRVFMILGFCYVASYCADSFFGGYWLIPEMDGRDRYSFGLAMNDAFLWQPRFGHEALGNFDFLGTLYRPMLRLDRACIHRTIYLSDDKGFDRMKHLPVSKVHPEFRDDWITKVAGTGFYDENKHVFQCTLRLTGSDSPRAIKEIQMEREMAQALGVAPPEGFVEKPFADYETYFKKNYVRWVGRLPLVRDHDVIVNIPAKQPAAGSGKIRFLCDLNKITKINHTKLCLVELKEPPTSETQTNY